MREPRTATRTVAVALLSGPHHLPARLHAPTFHKPTTPSLSWHVPGELATYVGDLPRLESPRRANGANLTRTLVCSEEQEPMPTPSMRPPTTPTSTTTESSRSEVPRLLITAGPTHEPIDAVRFIGNRSSGRMGVALAHAAARAGWRVTLLLGPATVQPTDPDVQVVRFRSCADLQLLLRTLTPQADILIMAAAVADYRPKTTQDMIFGGKFRRKNENLTLELEPTPDLLAEVGATRRPEQLFVGFALEPREEMLGAAQAKMARKKIDMIVANPLETMDSDRIEATLLYADGRASRTLASAPKEEAAATLVDAVGSLWRERAAPGARAHAPGAARR